jgi:hypothetical protein
MGAHFVSKIKFFSRVVEAVLLNRFDSCNAEIVLEE